MRLRRVLSPPTSSSTSQVRVGSIIVEDDQLKRRFYPEANVAGFTQVDGTIAFYNQVLAFIRPSHTVLEFGAGRGQNLAEDPVEFRRNIGHLRDRCVHLDGCDIDPIVLDNPFLDAAKVIKEDDPLPYEDNRFDVIVARYVFEHVRNPEQTALELLRVLKPGGVIAATTPNKYGYIGLGARLVPNRYHVGALSRIQPNRKPEDVFPTRYKLNTARSLKRHFGQHAEVFIAPLAAEPAYHFGMPWIYRATKWVNKHAPDAFLPILDVYVRKLDL